MARQWMTWIDRLVLDRLPKAQLWLRAAWLEGVPQLVRSCDWPEITVHAYRRTPIFASDAHNLELFDWEKAAIHAFFPKPPGRVLVGGAGGGREMVALANAGYEVAGFDPARELAQTIPQHVPTERLLGYEICDYAGLIANPASLSAFAPYDAVILGWGSLAHVADAATHRKLLEKLRELCPRGPVLLSWLSQPELGRERKALRHRLEPFRPYMKREPVFYDPYLGLIHLFSESDIRELAQQTHYRVAHLEASLASPHAVLLPASPPMEERPPAGEKR